MSDLGRDARDLIARAGAAELPSRADRERVWQSFAARSAIVTAGVGAAGIAASKTAGASGSALSTGTAALGASSVAVITKAAFVLALAGAVGGGAWALRPSGTSPKPTAPPVAVPRPPVVLPVVPPVQEVHPTPKVDATESPSLPSPRPRDRVRTLARAASSAPPTEASPVASSPDPANPPNPASSTKLDVDPKQEIDLIQRALQAEQSQDRPHLRALLDEHEARFPNGIFSDERAVMRVLLHCAEGNQDAALALARRLELSPQSPARLRLARSCVAQTTKDR